MEILRTFQTASWQETFSEPLQTEITTSLEQGSILFFPKLSFSLTENELPILSPACANAKSKNISYNPETDTVRGLGKEISSEQRALVQALLLRFSVQAQELVNLLFPRYTCALRMGKTSFRPVEVDGRVSSYRKDDKRLHVDAFPSNPNQGWRILRVFSNINPVGQSRVWRLGEPFEKVATRFMPAFRKPIIGSATLLNALKITKQRRTLYDHYMLQLHDAMKADEIYQREVKQHEFHFPANSTWVVQTDHVSHAAMSGQHLLEQTFYLPVEAMIDECHSPLRVLEKLLQRELV